MQFLTQKELIEAIGYTDNLVQNDLSLKQDNMTISKDATPLAGAGVVTTVNFTGGGVTAALVGNTVNVNIDAVSPTIGRFFYTQVVPSTTWVINHGLGFEVDVEVRNMGGQVVWADILHVNLNQVQVSFAQPFAGTATLG